MDKDLRQAVRRGHGKLTVSGKEAVASCLSARCPAYVELLHVEYCAMHESGHWHVKLRITTVDQTAEGIWPLPFAFAWEGDAQAADKFLAGCLKSWLVDCPTPGDYIQ